MKIKIKEVTAYKTIYTWEDEDITFGNGYYTNDATPTLVLIVRANWVPIDESYMLYNTKLHICFGGFSSGPTTKQELKKFFNYFNSVPKEVYEKEHNIT